MPAWRGATAFAAAMVVSPSSFGQPSSAGAVDVVIAAEDDASGQAMQAVVAELMARLDRAATVTFASSVNAAEVITPQAGAEVRLARAWIDLSKPERVTLYLVDRDWERILIRHIQKRAGHDELAREAIGHILENAVDALAHGARIGTAPDEVRSENEGAEPSLRPPATAAPIAARAGTASHWELGALYEGELYGPRGLIANGPAAVLYVGAQRGTVRPGVWLTVQYRLAMIVDTPPIGVRLDGGTLRALAGVDVALNERLSIRLGAGAGIDAIHMTPRLEGKPGTTIDNDEDFALVVARANAGGEWWVSRRLAIALTLSCDLDPSGTRYAALVDGVKQTVLSPWPVRPALSLGIMTE
jgi:hypothetical protein